MTQSNMPLELLSGAGFLLEIFFLFVLAQYLRRECIRRGLGKIDMMMMRFPPSMNLAVALLTCDVGVTIRSFVIWEWRTFGGAYSSFHPAEIIGLAFGGLLIIIGGLCKIRSVTQPDMGSWPWVASLAAVSLFAIVTLALR